MNIIDIELSKEYSFLSYCTLKCYLHEGVARPSVLIFPGGGYNFVSPREGEPVALRFYNEGYNAFVLTYSTADRAKGVHYPMQLLQATGSILYIKKNAGKLNCTGEVITCGFSAGGHLASMTAVYYDREVVLKSFNISKDEAKPSAVILCYAVISSTNTPHSNSFINLTGTNNADEHLKCSSELAINENTPPTFLWHTSNDNVVNVENSVIFANRLSECKVPYELHVFEKGPHGLSMCDRTTFEGNENMISPDVGVWFELCINWLKTRFKTK